MTDREKYQKRFFEYAIKRRGADKVFAAMQEVLGLKRGAAYKRMNGASSLTTTELLQLTEHFKFSLDSIFQNDQYVSFQHPFTQDSSTDSFLGQLVYFLKPAQDMEECEFTYLANELPVFHYFAHKHIFNFLISIWNHVHWSDKKLIIDERLEVTPQIKNVSSDISYYYSNHKVTEIWNSNMLANLYQQVIFCITIRAFKYEGYVSQLVNDIEKLINGLKEKVEGGDNGGSKIYINDYGNYLNLVLFQSEKVRSTFIGYDMPKFIVSYDPNFYQFSTDWIKKIKRKSVLVSAEGYQNRELFFLKLENDFKYFSERVDKLMRVYYE